MPKAPSEDLQQKIIGHVKKTFEHNKKLMEDYLKRQEEIYRAYSTYKGERQADWITNFKVNKSHEIVEKILPRIIAKDPRWLVSPRTDDFIAPKNNDPATEDPQDKADRYQKQIETANEYARGIQDYLSYIFDEYNLTKLARLWAKNMIVGGKGIAKIKYKYEIARILKDNHEDDLPPPAADVPAPEQQQLPPPQQQPPPPDLASPMAPPANPVDPSMQPIPQEGPDMQQPLPEQAPPELPQPPKKKKKVIEEVVTGEYPTIDVKSWSEVYYDPRYRLTSDRPSFIELVEDLRVNDLLRKKDRYFNLDKLKDICSYDGTRDSFDEYKRKIFSIAKIPDGSLNERIDKNALKLMYYYGYYQPDDDKDEKLYRICIVNEVLLVEFVEVTQIPFVEIDCFEDTETALSVGFVEPILGLQDELNFKKNSASTYINNALNRSWIWSVQSGIDPRNLLSKPNNIIVTTRTVPEAMQNCVEVPHREVQSSYFQELNDFERQIQSMTFTVDTSNQQNQQALTNTATGIRVKFFESNSVIDEIRKHFEQGLAQLAYKLLQETFENMQDNIVLKKMGEDGFWELNKELMRDAITRYTIRVEVNSSSYTDVDNRRQDALALFNIALQAKQAGVPIMLDEIFKDVLYTFEKKDPSRFIQPPTPQDIQQKMGGGGPIQQPPPQTTSEGQMANLTQQVAGGNIMSAIPQ